MLLHFRLKNFKSFKEKQDFSMISGLSKSYLDRVYKSKYFDVLKFAAIYGANGAGKSNLIDALSYFQKLVILGKPEHIKDIGFKLDQEYSLKPSYFEVILFFSSKNEFSSEWLYELSPNNKEKVIFERDIDKGKFIFEHKFKVAASKKIDVYKDDLKKDKDKLFLNYINSKNDNEVVKELPILQKVFRWILDIDIASIYRPITSGQYFLSEDKLKDMCNLLESFNTGIKRINTSEIKKELAYTLIPSKLIELAKNDMKDALNEKTKDSVDVLFRVNDNLFVLNFFKNDEIKFNVVNFYHEENDEIPFSLSEESEGTRRLIDLAEILITSDNNKLFVVDELDSKLHPQVTYKFVKLFLNKVKGEGKNIQLICATHESHLLDLELLRRDEVWFVDKNEKGESYLTSLEEFNVRNDKKIEKAYLDGRYGGVPIFDTLFPMD